MRKHTQNPYNLLKKISEIRKCHNKWFYTIVTSTSNNKNSFHAYVNLIFWIIKKLHCKPESKLNLEQHIGIGLSHNLNTSMFVKKIPQFGSKPINIYMYIYCTGEEKISHWCQIKEKSI